MSVIDDLLELVADPSSPLFDALDTHRARQADLAAVPEPAPGEFSPAYEHAFDEAVHAEAAARKVLADALGLLVPPKSAWPTVVQSGPVDWSKGRAA